MLQFNILKKALGEFQKITHETPYVIVCRPEDKKAVKKQMGELDRQDLTLKVDPLLKKNQVYIFSKQTYEELLEHRKQDIKDMLKIYDRIQRRKNKEV